MNARMYSTACSASISLRGARWCTTRPARTSQPLTARIVPPTARADHGAALLVGLQEPAVVREHVAAHAGLEVHHHALELERPAAHLVGVAEVPLQGVQRVHGNEQRGEDPQHREEDQRERRVRGPAEARQQPARRHTYPVDARSA
jgi:hypothetical protein